MHIQQVQAGSPNKAPGAGKQKINLMVHMQGENRVNFTTFKTDRFEKAGRPDPNPTKPRMFPILNASYDIIKTHR